MKQCTSNLNVLNQYFSNLAESFELTCKQLKVLKEEKRRVQELKSIEEEIRAINILERLKESNHSITVSGRFTVKELETMKSNFYDQLTEYTVEEDRICFEYSFWKQRYNSQVLELVNIMNKLKDNKQKLVIIYRSEIKILLAVYKEKSRLENSRIINCNDYALKYFPEDNLSQEFIKAYYDYDYEKMQRLAKEYIDF